MHAQWIYIEASPNIQIVPFSTLALWNVHQLLKKPYLLCMHSCNIFTTYHLYAIHRRLCCNTTIKNKKDNLKRSVFPALTAKMCKEWFSLEKGQFNPQFWNALKINKKLKNLIFDRERLFLKKLIYSIMPQRDYPATKVQIYKTLERVLGLEQ